MCEEKIKRDKAYDVALATRNFEIELFWKRSIFFWGFIASSFVGYAALMKAHSSLAIVIVGFGFVCSCAWTLVNRGSKRWQENWELLVAEKEDEITGKLFEDRRYKEDDHSWLSAQQFSVSKVAIALSDFTALVWLILMCWHVVKIFYVPEYAAEIGVISISVLSIFFAIIMICQGKSSD